MNINHGEVTAVIGQKNSGKSVLSEGLLTEMGRFVCIDPNSEHGPPGAVAVESYDDVWRRWMNGETRQVVRDRRGALNEERMPEYVRAVGQLQDAYLFLDEAHNYMNSGKCPDCIRKLAKYAVSHQNIWFVFGVHLASDIPSELWSQIDNFVIFAYGDKWDNKMQKASIPCKKVVQDGYRRSKAEELSEKHGIPESVLRTGLDPNSYQFLAYKDELGNSPAVRGPVPIPDHLS